MLVLVPLVPLVPLVLVPLVPNPLVSLPRFNVAHSQRLVPIA